jgi:hypothetical protein
MKSMAEERRLLAEIKALRQKNRQLRAGMEKVRGLAAVLTLQHPRSIDADVVKHAVDTIIEALQAAGLEPMTPEQQDVLCGGDSSDIGG